MPRTKGKSAHRDRMAAGGDILKRWARRQEKLWMEWSLRQAGGNQREAAARLGMNYVVFRAKVRKHGLESLLADLKAGRAPEGGMPDGAAPPLP